MLYYNRDIYMEFHLNGLSSALKDYHLIQYADDSQILLSGTIKEIDSLVYRAEKALLEAKRYFQINGLNVNAGKTQCIFIGSRQLISKLPLILKYSLEILLLLPPKL